MEEAIDHSLYSRSVMIEGGRKGNKKTGDLREKRRGEKETGEGKDARRSQPAAPEDATDNNRRRGMKRKKRMGGRGETGAAHQQEISSSETRDSDGQSAWPNASRVWPVRPAHSRRNSAASLTGQGGDQLEPAEPQVRGRFPTVSMPVSVLEMHQVWPSRRRSSRPATLVQRPCVVSSPLAPSGFGTSAPTTARGRGCLPCGFSIFFSSPEPQQGDSGVPDLGGRRTHGLALAAIRLGRVAIVEQGGRWPTSPRLSTRLLRSTACESLGKTGANWVLVA